MTTPRTTLENARQNWAGILAEITTESADRDRSGELPVHTVRRLAAAGLGAYTVPRELGGHGANLAELLAELELVAEADPNVAQALRPHFAYVQRQLLAPPAERHTDDLRRVAAGEIFATASHERSVATVGSLATRLESGDDGQIRLSGRKHYSTGSLYADWISVVAEHGGDTVSATVSATTAGVTRNDDWNGFGQRLTASGTTDFVDVLVDPDRVQTLDSEESATPMTAYYQLVLLASLAGVARAVLRDAAEFVRNRTRVYSHGAGRTAAEDPLVQETVGELAAASFAASAIVGRAAEAANTAHAAITAAGGLGSTLTPALRALVEQAEAAATAAQVSVVPLVLDATTRLFEVGGASATSRTLAFDRHWRNARTLASHNPTRYKTRAIGEYTLSGSGLTFGWATGEKSAAPTPRGDNS